MTTNENTTQEADKFTAWMDRKRHNLRQDLASMIRWNESLWRAAWEAGKALQCRCPAGGGF
ncbi:hypothetical protein [Clavibacter sp. VKM Ac-2872]|uniref:hypothetical protein n=1 Tax=Clavibacter sp. VKM Ac-2872 TaxID=2783812 RepID=UPI001889DBF7|nr:hypothetical protein [Clavibacter sp. VKM Ac-2872]MBF4625903.1 hypothetical protein [Clavibacter sp. VKM Ac-2872]